jgi:hypothetical protein
MCVCVCVCECVCALCDNLDLLIQVGHVNLWAQGAVDKLWLVFDNVHALSEVLVRHTLPWPVGLAISCDMGQGLPRHQEHFYPAPCRSVKTLVVYTDDVDILGIIHGLENVDAYDHVRDPVDELLLLFEPDTAASAPFTVCTEMRSVAQSIAATKEGYLVCSHKVAKGVAIVCFRSPEDVCCTGLTYM